MVGLPWKPKSMEKMRLPQSERLPAMSADIKYSNLSGDVKENSVKRIFCLS